MDEEGIKPRRRQSKKIFGFSETKFRDFAGYFILIGWLWYDLIDSHGKIVKLCFLAISLSIAHGLACSFFKSRSKAISLWIITVILVAVVVWANSRPEPKPHLKLVLASTTEWPNLNLELTNAPIFSKDGRILSTIDVNSFLVVPVAIGKTNECLSFNLIPDSPVLSDVAEIVISIPKNVQCSPAVGWSESEFSSMDGQYEKDIGAKLDLRNLLPGDWIKLPPLSFPAPIDNLNSNAVMAMRIRIRGVGMPTIFMDFWVDFPIMTNTLKPKLVIGTKPPGVNIPFQIPYP